VEGLAPVQLCAAEHSLAQSIHRDPTYPQPDQGRVDEDFGDVLLLSIAKFLDAAFVFPNGQKQLHKSTRRVADADLLRRHPLPPNVRDVNVKFVGLRMAYSDHAQGEHSLNRLGLFSSRVLAVNASGEM